MKTRLKPNQPLTWYHVMTRTAQQMFWLENPKFKALFLELVERYSKIYFVNVEAFTLMSTHTHLCLAVEKPPFNLDDVRKRFELAQEYVVNKRPFREEMADYYYRKYTDLSKFMWDVKWHFSRAYNKINKKKGTFWDGPFKSLVIGDANHLLQCMAYIELNPVRAGMVSNPEDFEFSSIYRIKDALEKGEADPTPAVGRLAHLADGERGKAYLALTGYLAKVARNGGSISGEIPQFLMFWFGAKALSETLENFQSKAPANWSEKVYGTAHSKELLLGNCRLEDSEESERNAQSRRIAAMAYI